MVLGVLRGSIFDPKLVQHRKQCNAQKEKRP
jgi:hypothetical protein